MARGRMVNQTIATDKKLNELSIEAELLYLKTIPHLDRDGLILGEPVLLWAQVCPRRPSLMAGVCHLIEEWSNAGLVVPFEDNGDTVLFFPGFTKNQIGMRYDRETPSRFGVPPGFIRTDDGLQPINVKVPSENTDPTDGGGGANNGMRSDAGSLPEVCRINDGLSRPNIKGSLSLKEGVEARARAHSTTPVQASPPPSPNGNGTYFGMARPTFGKEKRTIDGLVKSVEKLGMTMPVFREMVDAYLARHGLLDLANGDSDAAGIALGDAQQAMLALCETDARFRTVKALEDVIESWLENDYRSPSLPKGKQVADHAGKIKANTVVCERKDKPPGPAKPEKLSFKQWMLRTYNVDTPTFISVPKSELDKGYQDYVKQFQLQH